ncbi:pan domain-containing protein [Cystoisospora suis]|uniref:Pan domain-containing protein n=1 Tax=Cystoisospora suis TaxID=483139 RepID=A0A2C6KGC7_9APIC|nr:pan domain-containing protein [Cystoisospora suis]
MEMHTSLSSFTSCHLALPLTCCRAFFALDSSFVACDFSMESGFFTFTLAVVLSVLAVLGSQPQVYGIRHITSPPLSQQQEKNAGSQESGEIAMVETGVRSLQNHSASVAEKSVMGAAPCVQVDVGSTAPNMAVRQISAESTTEGFRKCQLECQGAPGCTHLTYNAYTRKCFLKNSPSMYRYKGGDMTATRDCDLNQDACFKMHTGSTASDVKDVPKLVPQNPPAEEILVCQALCQKARHCTHFTYNTVTGKCFMKKGNPSYRGYRDDMSASKDCNLGTTNELQALAQAKPREAVKTHVELLSCFHNDEHHHMITKETIMVNSMKMVAMTMAACWK